MITIIFGPNGYGKTSLMNHFGNINAFDTARNLAGNRFIQNINEAYGLNIAKKKHLVYSSEECTFKKENYRKRDALKVNPKALGIQGEAPDGVICQYIDRYATLLIDEGQKHFPSTQDLPVHVLAFFEMHRHYDLDIYLACTRAMKINKSIRELAQGIKINGKEVITGPDGVKKVIWDVDCIPTGMIDDYLSCSPAEKRKCRIRQKIKADYNIYSLYNSTSHAEEFYKDYKKMKIGA